MIVPSRARTSSMLLSVLACSEPRGATKTQGVSPIDQGDRAVLHLGRRIALGVDVADLLELEGPLERDRESGGRGRGRARSGPGRTAAAASSISGSVLRTSPSSDGHRLDRIDDGQAVGEREVPQPAEVEGQQESGRSPAPRTPWCWRRPTSGPAWR